MNPAYIQNDVTGEDRLLDELESLELDWELIKGRPPEMTLFCSKHCTREVILETSHLTGILQKIPLHKLSQEKEYICPYEGCLKSYAKGSHLRAHLRRHTGEKPFICSWIDCQWRFSRSDELARHMRSHSGLKPYVCIYCFKRFARSDHLGKHSRVHTRKYLRKIAGTPEAYDNEDVQFMSTSVN